MAPILAAQDWADAQESASLMQGGGGGAWGVGADAVPTSSSRRGSSLVDGLRARFGGGDVFGQPAAQLQPEDDSEEEDEHVRIFCSSAGSFRFLLQQLLKESGSCCSPSRSEAESAVWGRAQGSGCSLSRVESDPAVWPSRKVQSAA
jgi:hypothetical protein